MTFDRVAIAYTLRFTSAFHCGTGLSRLLLDRTVRRDAEGYLVVPGSTFKGALRHRCEQLARLLGIEAPSPHDEQASLTEYETPSVLSHLFGSRVRSGSLWFDDLKLSDAERHDSLKELQTSERTQVSLSRATGTAKPQLLFSSEFGIGDTTFEGTISGFAPRVHIGDDDSLPNVPLLLLWAGLLALDKIGGNKSTGMGRCQINVNRFEISKNVNRFEISKEVKEEQDWFTWLEYMAENS